MRGRLLYILWVLLVSTTSTATQAPDFPPGRLTENVASTTTPAQRFAVYLPTSYSPARPAPILYVMDPRGRGRVAARLFQPAAERYGYIVVSSYNTASDGQAEVTLRALQAMWDDSHDWFQIDERRVYLAGFSGTARIASLVARNRRQAIAGVIGAGAGFHPDVRADRKSAFAYFATVGDEDYNFHELETLERSLVSLDLPHRVERFHGPHSWMPAPLAERSIEWMELRAMQQGTRPKDEALVATWWTRDEEAARSALSDGRDLDAGRGYAAIARDFAGLRDTSEAKALADRILSSPPARTQRNRRQSDGQKSREWVRHAMGIISASFPEGENTPVRTAAELARELELARLKESAEATAESALEARRRLNEIEVQLGFYLPQQAIITSELSRASYYLSVALQINDRSPVTWYLLSQACAQMNARRDALDALGRAIAAGFRDVALLESDPAFRRLRAEPDFAALVQQLKITGDTLDLLTVDRPPLPVPVR